MYEESVDQCMGCGNFIVWRTKNGKARPYHCQCRVKTAGQRKFRIKRSGLESRLCPKCREKHVFYYRDARGGFACFEKLWPHWTLHPCYHPEDEILHGEKCPTLKGEQFWIKALLVPANKNYNCLIYGNDFNQNGVLLEVIDPQPHRYHLRKMLNELFLIRSKSKGVWEVEGLLAEGIYQSFTAELIHTQATFSFLDDPFPKK